MMTVKIDESYIRSFSTETNEPAWLTDVRLAAVEQVEELALPKPDKTRITNWNITELTKHDAQGPVYNSLNDLPEAAKAAVNTEEANENIFVQHNNTTAYLSLSDELKAQGVIFTNIITAAKEHPELVQKYFMTE